MCTRCLSMVIAWGALYAAPGIAQELAANDDMEVERVIVTGTVTPESSKTATPFKEIPQNIQVLSAELLRDQGAHILDDALRNVAGVMPGGYYDGWDYFRIRGFDASGYIYLDNLLYDVGIQPNAELFGLEQVEVVKGPSSSLFGQDSLGGLVNLVSKRPKSDRFAEFGASYGSFNSWELTADAGTALTSSGNVLGRIVALDRHDGAFTDYADGKRRVYIAPSLTWTVDSDTTITLLSSYQRDRFSMGFPLPALGTVFASSLGYVPLSRYTGEPGRSNLLHQQRAQGGYDFRHRLNDMFSVQQNFRYAYSDSNWENLLYPGFLDADQRTLYRYPYNGGGQWSNLSVDTSVHADFTTSAVEHSLLAGIDYYHNTYHWHSEQIDYNDLSQYLPLDLYAPVYGATVTPGAIRDTSRQLIDFIGFYVQEHAKLGPVTLTAGGRYDIASEDDYASGVLSATHRENKFVPRVGATYEFVPGISAYASYSQSFVPQYGVLAGGGSVGPESGEQYEIGVKTSLLNGRVNTTAAAFDLTRQNVATDDPLHPGFSITTGEQRSRGFEFDGQFVIAEGWELIASYAYIDAVVTKDNFFPVGDHSINVPPHSLNLWMKYEFREGALKGLAVSLGGNHYSSQLGDLPNTFHLPSYTLVNGNLSYDIGRYRLQLNVKNILGERYFVGSYNDLYVNPGVPRTFSARLSWRM